MRRTQVQIEDDLYQALRQEAFQRGISISELVRRVLKRHLWGGVAASRGRTFSFVGMARSQQGRLAPVSERHDEALWDE
jgi:predicted DNA-binding ribbon-helix-helix protein